MCTALSLKTGDRYFGRNLDIDISYGERVCVMPRRFPLEFRQMGKMERHFAIIGMATVAKGVPLFYDAVNEYGLSAAGLNFPGNAYYAPVQNRKDNIASFELIPWILSQCKTTADAKKLLSRLNICDTVFSDMLPTAPLHWMICGGDGNIVIESMYDGLHVYDNPVSVLTNNPPFEYQLDNLEKYKHLKNSNAGVEKEEKRFYTSYCQGLGAVGLPGDVSSMSRFVRADFLKKHSVCESDELSSVSQFFHLLSSVEMVKGVCHTDGGGIDITVYSSCMNIDRGLYYYTTYDNRRISCVNMHNTDLDSDKISEFLLDTRQSVEYRN